MNHEALIYQDSEENLLFWVILALTFEMAPLVSRQAILLLLWKKNISC